jgi:protein phosphatase
MRLWAWGQSDPGRKRERNEDSYLVDPTSGLLAVADGMGGHQGGATASRMAIELIGREIGAAAGDFDKALAEQLQGAMRTTEEMDAVDGDAIAGPGDLYRQIADMPTPPAGVVPLGHEPTQPLPAPMFSPPLELMRSVVRRASSAIFEAAWAKPELRGMGTTLTAMLVHAGRAHVVHAGDSRCYMFRDGQLRQITDDHSWIAEQLRSGSITEAEAKSSKFRHVITKSIGFEREIDADLKVVPISAGDCFVLCSDGMSNYVEHGELERIVAMTWYRQLPQTLIDLANSRGGDDNITVVVGLVANEPPA